MIRSPDGDDDEMPRLGPFRADDYTDELPDRLTGQIAKALSAA
jgi:hypothetical protein